MPDGSAPAIPRAVIQRYHAEMWRLVMVRKFRHGASIEELERRFGMSRHVVEAVIRSGMRHGDA